MLEPKILRRIYSLGADLHLSFFDVNEKVSKQYGVERASRLTTDQGKAFCERLQHEVNVKGRAGETKNSTAIDGERHLNYVDGSKFLSVSETAEELDITPPAVRNYLSLGRLAAYKFKNLTLISKEELDKFKKTLRKHHTEPA